MKKNFLLFLLFSLAVNLSAASYDFPFSELGPLWRHTTVSIEYTDGNDYADIIFEPTGGFWEAQAGWAFAELDEEFEDRKFEPKDFTGNKELVIEFEAVSIASGLVIFGIESTVDNGYFEVAVTPETGTAKLDLGKFSDDQLASIAHVSLMVSDAPEETAILRVNKIYLVEGAPERGDFLLSKLGPLWGHTTVTIDYKDGDEYATMNYSPTGGFWEAQAGWSYPNVLDLSPYTALVLEFEDVIADDHVGVRAELVSDAKNSEGNDVIFSEGIYWVDMSITIDLTQQTEEVLSRIKMLSIMVMDNNVNPAVLLLKGVYLEGDETPVKQVYGNDSGLVDVHSITGVKLKSQVDRNEALKELEKGLYIIGGKKVFVVK